MRRVSMALLVAASLVAAACAPARAAGTDPKAFLQGVMQRLGSGHMLPADQLYTPALAGLLRQSAAAAHKGDAPCMDGDPVLDCQDCSPLTHLTVTVSDPVQGKADASAHYTVAGDERDMKYTLVQTPRGWRIDDIRSSAMPSLRAYLAGPDCR